MARLSKDEHNELMRLIMETGGPTDNMEELIRKLQDDFDEREGELARYGETADRTDPREPERDDSEPRQKESSGEAREGEESTETERINWEEKYNILYNEHQGLRKKYIDRYFTSPEEITKDEAEDVKKDDESTEVTFDELFKERVKN